MPLDLYVSLVYSLVTGGVLASMGVGSITALPLLLVVPGYGALAILYPSNRAFDWTERLGLSIGLSVAITPLVALVLEITRIGMTFTSLVGALTIFNVATTSLAHLRRTQERKRSNSSLSIEIGFPRRIRTTNFREGIPVAFLAVVVCVAGIYALLPAPADGQKGFTQFYILGQSGNAEDYPATLNVSQPGSVLLGITNHENAGMSYAVRIDLAGIDVIHNFTSGLNETVEVSRQIQSWVNTSISDGQTWSQPYVFSFASAGLWRLHFLLYKEGILTNLELSLLFHVV